MTAYQFRTQTGRVIEVQESGAGFIVPAIAGANYFRTITDARAGIVRQHGPEADLSTLRRTVAKLVA